MEMVEFWGEGCRVIVAVAEKAVVVGFWGLNGRVGGVSICQGWVEGFLEV